ncbi:MAG TPA: MFS transporter, partial [Stellaceae bacterium]|nr:MFS transporter [Stellaceae bacterium]
RAAAIVSSIAGTLFFWRVFTYHQPIVDLRTFRNRNFALGTFYTFVIGTGLYGATYVIPLFLAQIRGFSAFQIGTTVVVTGLSQMVISPFTARIARAIDLRLMLGFGMGLFAVAMYLTAMLTNQSSFTELLIPQIVRGCALMFCYLPANLISLSTLRPDMLKNGAGLYNLTRDLGGAIGLATIGTIMTHRLNFHWNRLIEDINPARPAVQHFLNVETERFDPHFAAGGGRAALKVLAATVHREALVLTFNDVILMLGVLFVVGVLLMPLVRSRSSFMS